MVVNVKRILLVEDSPYDAELTLTVLAEHRLANEVDIARDGEEALDYLYRRGRFQERENSNPTVVLLDLKLPKVDGLEVLRQIKGNESTRKIPVVMLTSSAEERDLIETYRLGVNSFIVKPLDFAQFTETVAKTSLYWMLVNKTPA